MKATIFIPARGGSKGIPKKNITLLNGKPLINYSIDAALASVVDQVVVSTDSLEIQNTVYSYYKQEIETQSACLKFHQRPASLAKDDSSIIDGVLHYVQTENLQSSDIIILLQPTSPIRRIEHINEVIKLFLTQDIQSLVSICMASQHPCEMITRTQHGWGFLLKPALNQQRQAYPQAYFINGSIYAATVSFLTEHKSFWDKESYFYMMSQIYSIDIDHPDDLWLAEGMLNHLATNQGDYV